MNITLLGIEIPVPRWLGLSLLPTFGLVALWWNFDEIASRVGIERAPKPPPPPEFVLSEGDQSRLLELLTYEHVPSVRGVRPTRLSAQLAPPCTVVQEFEKVPVTSGDSHDIVPISVPIERIRHPRVAHEHVTFMIGEEQRRLYSEEPEKLEVLLSALALRCKKELAGSP